MSLLLEDVCLSSLQPVLFLSLFQVHRQKPAMVDLSHCQEGFTRVERETDTDSCSFSTFAAVGGAVPEVSAWVRH